MASRPAPYRETFTWRQIEQVSDLRGVITHFITHGPSSDPADAFECTCTSSFSRAHTQAKRNWKATATLHYLWDGETFTVFDDAALKKAIEAKGTTTATTGGTTATTGGKGD